MTIEVYLAYLATVAVFFATPPGPSQILMITNSMRHGVMPSRATVAGDLSANSLQMLAAGFGLAALIAQSATAFIVIKWLGVAYLVWVGVRTFLARPPAVSGGAVPTASARQLYMQGFLTSAANPKAVFFFAALFPQFIDPAAPIWPQLFALGATYLVVDGTILMIYGGLATRVMGGLRQQPVWLNRVSGCLMVLAAGLLALKDGPARAR
jgi:homoserine/homoserine lactone efflux protein